MLPWERGCLLRQQASEQTDARKDERAGLEGNVLLLSVLKKQLKGCKKILLLN